MSARIHVARVVAAAAALCLLIGAARGGPAAAQAQSAQGDNLQLIRLTAGPASAEAPDGEVRFEAVVDYRLQSAPSGLLLLFVFENDTRNARRDSSEGTRVAAGAGRATLNVLYQPHAGAERLILLAGLFKEDETMLAWTATTPVSLDPWPGRAAFARAMAARLAGDYAQAAEHLTAAIELAPETAPFYYWRADSRLRLGQYDTAVQDYTRALELAPQDRASRAGRGIALLWQEAWEPAIEELTQVIGDATALDEPAIWALRARAVAHAALNQAAEATADYQAYLALVPDAPDRAEVERWLAALGA